MRSGRLPAAEIRHVFFDAAGTLFRLREPLAALYTNLALRHGFQIREGVDLQREIHRRFHGEFRRSPPLRFPGASPEEIPLLEQEWWKNLVEKVFRGLGSFPAWEPFFTDLYETFRGAGAWQLEPACRETLMRLHALGYSLGIISNFDTRLHDLLKELQISEFFQQITLSSLAGTAKPEREIFQFALRQAGAEATTSLHVGDDRIEDFEAALRAGLHALWYTPKDPGASSGLRLRSLADLPAFLI